MMGVTAARGFSAGGISSGIKQPPALDLAIVLSDGPAAASAVFTRSRTPAAPVVLGRRRIANGRLRAVLLNSGCANAATGGAGMMAAITSTKAVATVLSCEASEVLPCSTGPIGPRLPIGAMVEAIPHLVATSGRDDEHATAAARAIMTTDTVPKQASSTGDGYVIGGMAKGAGMLRPDMATMLAVMTTDAVVDAATLEGALHEATDVSFNSINVDGCMSTNDTVVMLASGASGTVPNRQEFVRTLTEVATSLARQLADDAEGSSRVVTIRVSGAADAVQARRIGKTIADSALVRSSFYGGDPNWGRIVAALGATDAIFDPDRIRILYAGVPVAINGVSVTFDEGTLSERLGTGEFDVDVEIGEGPGHAEILTTDLTPEYVRFNGERS